MIRFDTSVRADDLCLMADVREPVSGLLPRPRRRPLPHEEDCDRHEHHGTDGDHSPCVPRRPDPDPQE